MKTDARVRYTRQIIQHVFIDLLKQKPLNKITVKEICEKAEINRSTFYKHYEDVYHLMHKLEESALNQLELLLFGSAHNGNIHVLTTLLTSLLEYKDLLTSLTAKSPDSDFLNRLAERCSQYAVSHLASGDVLEIGVPVAKVTPLPPVISSRYWHLANISDDFCASVCAMPATFLIFV